MKHFRTFFLLLLACSAGLPEAAADAGSRGSIRYSGRSPVPAPVPVPVPVPGRPPVRIYSGPYTVRDCWDPYRMRAVTCSELEELQRNRIKENRNKNPDCWDFSKELPDYCRDVPLPSSGKSSPQSK